MGKVKVKHVSFYTRLLRELFLVEILVAILILAPVLSSEVDILRNGILIVFAVLFQALWLVRTLKQEKYCLTEIEVDDESVKVNGYRFDKPFYAEYPLQDIDIRLKSVFRKGSFAYRVEFIDKDKHVLFYQYRTAEFKKSDAKKLFKYFKKYKGRKLSFDEKDALGRQWYFKYPSIKK